MVERSLQPWRTFEDVVRSIVSQQREFFGVESFEPAPAKIQGASGHRWDIEVIGYLAGSRKMVLFEVRRKTTRNIEPGEAGELACRIEDTGAGKGYFVTPLTRGLSKGAKKIAEFKQIGHVKISVTSTPDNYLMQCVDKVFAGFADGIQLKDSLSLELKDDAGKLLSSPPPNKRLERNRRE
jgi:hypothetical protein